MKRNKAFFIALCCSAVVALVLTRVYSVILPYDATSYIQAWSSLGQGRPDMLRTPVYPLILHLMQTLFESRFLSATVILQYLVFFASIWFFQRLADFFCSPKASFWVLLFYAACPAICILNNLILTESFAISGCVILLYLAQRLVQSPTWGKTALFTLQCLFLLFLRPAFVYILPVFGVFSLILFFQHKKRTAVCCLTGILVSSLCLVGYMSAFKKEYGVFAPSSVGTVNQYSMARISGYLNPADSPDPLLRKDLEDCLEAHGSKVDVVNTATLEGLDLSERHRLADIQSTVAAGRRRVPSTVTKALFRRVFESSMEPAFVFSVWTPFLNRISRTFGPPLAILYLFLLVYSILFCIRIFQTRTFPPYGALLLMLELSSIIVAVVGAQSDWGRLLAPTTPIWLLLAGQVGRLFQQKDVSVRE